MLKYPSNVCLDEQWTIIKQILIHPKFATYTAGKKNLRYDVAMIQLETKIRQPTMNDVIRPVCLPEPGLDQDQIRSVINSRNWTPFSSTIMTQQDCVNQQRLKDTYHITLERFD